MITVSELDQIMKECFLSSQLKKVGWGELSEQDKDVLISKATLEIDRLMFIGDKLDESQPHAFPRLVNNKIIEVYSIRSAIAQFVYDYLYLETDESIQKAKSGITSIKIADASESYSTSVIDIEGIKNSYKRYLADFIYRGC